jgi:hypothetical protein
LLVPADERPEVEELACGGVCDSAVGIRIFLWLCIWQHCARDAVQAEEKEKQDRHGHLVALARYPHAHCFGGFVVPGPPGGRGQDRNLTVPLLRSSQPNLSECILLGRLIT